ncbi:MAG TPA: translation initiation factor IF-2 N-terminal domain-containing protein, partial [Cyanophyceae cyanobacterium]
MNNDRVRIYELSKELHLENRDLLAICNELNIAVKSHSSTITEVDAERIRAVAATQVAHAASSRRESATTKSGARSHPPGKAQPKSSPPHKQQILEIRKSPTL